MNKIGFHQSIRCIVCSLVGLLIALLSAAGGGAVWLWGWTWKGSSAFNESWTAEERAAISGFDVYLRQQYAKDISELMAAIARAFQQVWGGEPVCPGLSRPMSPAWWPPPSLRCCTGLRKAAMLPLRIPSVFRIHTVSRPPSLPHKPGICGLSRRLCSMEPTPMPSLTVSRMEIQRPWRSKLRYRPC